MLGGGIAQQGGKQQLTSAVAIPQPVVICVTLWSKKVNQQCQLLLLLFLEVAALHSFSCSCWQHCAAAFFLLLAVLHHCCWHRAAFVAYVLL